MIVAITKFTHGAWVIIVFVPIMVVVPRAAQPQYEGEDDALEHDAPQAVAAPVLRRLVVMVFVDGSTSPPPARMQFGRTLTPDELRAVHFDLDPVRTEDLTAAWTRLGLARVSLEILELPDRRLEPRRARAGRRRARRPRHRSHAC